MALKLALCIFWALPCLAQVEQAVAPGYPPLAVAGRVGGSVAVDVRVSERGVVISATVAEGDALLRQASLDAARLWQFKPQPSSHPARLIFSYKLMPKNTPEAELGAIFKPPYWVEVRKVSPEPVSHIAQAEPPADGKRQD